MPLFGGRDLKKIFFLNYFFILAVLGLRWCMCFSLVVASGGYSLVAVEGLLTAVASLTVERGLRSCGSGAPQHRLPSCGTCVELL